jgi:hypothetical protein
MKTIALGLVLLISGCTHQQETNTRRYEIRCPEGWHPEWRQEADKLRSDQVLFTCERDQ